MDNSIVQVSSSKFRVPHILQQDSFDCGIACVCMVLRGLGFVEVDLRELNKQVAVSSIWTIDLVSLIFGESFAKLGYSNICLQINKSKYSNQSLKIENDFEDRKLSKNEPSF